MSKIQINELDKNNSELKELGDWETNNIIGGYKELPDMKVPSREVIQKAMKDSLMRIDISQNSNPVNHAHNINHSFKDPLVRPDISQNTNPVSQEFIS